jgi:transcriptional regulator with XRE-family HTH domain
MPQPAKKTPPPVPGIDTAIGKRIAQSRTKRGYSQAALAEEMGISRKQVVDYETGRVHLNDEMIIRFAVMLKVSADELLGIKPSRSSDDQSELRFTKRFRDLALLPEDKKRAVLKILDDLIKANT